MPVLKLDLFNAKPTLLYRVTTLITAIINIWISHMVRSSVLMGFFWGGGFKSVFNSWQLTELVPSIFLAIIVGVVCLWIHLPRAEWEWQAQVTKWLCVYNGTGIHGLPVFILMPSPLHQIGFLNQGYVRFAEASMEGCMEKQMKIAILTQAFLLFLHDERLLAFIKRVGLVLQYCSTTFCWNSSILQKLLETHNVKSKYYRTE